MNKRLKNIIGVPVILIVITIILILFWNIISFPAADITIKESNSKNDLILTNISDQEQNFLDVNIYFESKEGQTFELPTQKVDHMWPTEEKWFHYNDYKDILPEGFDTNKMYVTASVVIDKDKFLPYVLVSFAVIAIVSIIFANMIEKEKINKIEES